jgi:copper chaperone CopZ
VAVITLEAEMNCRACEQRVERALRRLDGVEQVKTDLLRRKVAIRFDPDQLSERELQAAVEESVNHGHAF